ncbi:MAG TPA: hypothetical protein VKR83_17300 [Ktedonobacteraceae bacterium]|nr:hypothetical protein [Ktedonobacteraceae bacterium]
MISLRQRLQCLPLLYGGIAAGLMLTMITRVNRGAELAMAMLMVGMPFLLAALTGLGKTTTA